MDKVGVHASHCCAKPGHGCKYGNLDCPVLWGTVLQGSPCEQCDEEWEQQGSPECATFYCHRPARWVWVCKDVHDVAQVAVTVSFILCDDHDKWHRQTINEFRAEPLEDRKL